MSEYNKEFDLDTLFADAIGRTEQKLMKLFQVDDVDLQLRESKLNDPPFHRIAFIALRIPGKLDDLSFIWDSKKGIVDQHAISINPAIRGQGYGSKVNRIIDEFARDVLASTVRVSSISNDRWMAKLLRTGYVPDDHDSQAVQKRV